MGTICGSWTGTEPSQGSVATGSHCDAIPLSGDSSIILTQFQLQSTWIFGYDLHVHVLVPFVSQDPRHAGKYDGVLGVLGAIQAVAALRQTVWPPAAAVTYHSVSRC